MITLSNDHILKFMTASGVSGWYGKCWSWEWPLHAVGAIIPELFTNVTKTITLEPRKGNFSMWKPWDTIRPIKNGVVNAVGLSNPGLWWWIERFGKCVPYNTMLSVAGTPGELKQIGDVIFAYGLDIAGIEVNASCPNVGCFPTTQDIIKGLSVLNEGLEQPIILKVSVAQDYIQLVKECLKEIPGVVEAVSINSVPWRMAFPDKESPLARYGGGGVSGEVVHGMLWDALFEIHDEYNMPIILPVWEKLPVASKWDVEGMALSFGSRSLLKPWYPTKAVLNYV